jgi:hypothetical protein
MTVSANVADAIMVRAAAPAVRVFSLNINLPPLMLYPSCELSLLPGLRGMSWQYLKVG